MNPTRMTAVRQVRIRQFLGVWTGGFGFGLWSLTTGGLSAAAGGTKLAGRVSNKTKCVIGLTLMICVLSQWSKANLNDTVFVQLPSRSDAAVSRYSHHSPNRAWGYPEIP